ncbi:unnamed protein product [Adineta ricciae]|uniref:Uncharacterized protein n=1 Tax=Adineta ricciae TaxID=249248 RepID=A0A814TBU5_ADIRI|nr:unnamed protein product [Adineta ricciae]CAF1453627.1 unnamed protein product [Adineta ricciae]
MLKTAVLLLMTCAAFAAALNQHRTVDIIENGMFIKQTVTQYDDLHVIEVPQHGDRAHIVAYLDFRSGLQLIKDMESQRCQLSNMEAATRIAHSRMVSVKSTDNGLSMPDLPVDASGVEEIRVFKLERQDAIQNTSYLRLELQQACAGLAIHWADSVNENDVDRMVQNDELMYDKQEKIILQPTNPESRLSRQNSCNPNPQAMPPNQFNCHGNCVIQKCKMTGSSCYYFIHCPMNGNVGQQCVQHVLTAPGQCKLCCDDPTSPCSSPTNGGYWQRCSCLNW